MVSEGIADFLSGLFLDSLSQLNLTDLVGSELGVGEGEEFEHELLIIFIIFIYLVSGEGVVQGGERSKHVGEELVESILTKDLYHPQVTTNLEVLALAKVRKVSVTCAIHFISIWDGFIMNKGEDCLR